MDSGFLVVVPNYRLTPQVAATMAFKDCEDAYECAVGALPAIVEHRMGVTVDPTKTVAMGHSSGGTLALHLASRKPIKAVTAFYPSLFFSDTSTSAHWPTSVPPFGSTPDYQPSEEDWDSIAPDGEEVSEVDLAVHGTDLAPRNKWQVQLIKTGRWMAAIQPDGNFAATDPLTRLSADWPPAMLVQREVDDVPGSSLELARRAEREMKDAGVEEVALAVVAGQGHVFDLPPGASEVGDPRWAAVVKGLDWLKSHGRSEKKTPSRRGRVPQLDVHIWYV